MDGWKRVCADGMSLGHVCRGLVSRCARMRMDGRLLEPSSFNMRKVRCVYGGGVGMDGLEAHR